ncbi:YciY family protein [Edwardsiella tarda]|uniref:Uncharacterized protein YciY n=4 Tax=Edwardsiella TaxID=635 RepID=A0A376DG74_9GAMM|nr:MULTISPECIES: YciY family protein [Edwardsiella]QPR26995.1 YciY family protein [Edwardsiella hoshinae]UAL55005.1 YciY family protein [Edwardsiella tarda]UBU95199.1 YciY family protein [Edwardsiella tarda]UCP98934.1 YciY family protein [Edwardsiella tarda ATCC 15947 = NBRC 105688]UCQ10160.1 YciY family protein [Edwardsiella tarda]
MRHSRNEVGRWRMLRQIHRRRSHWLEGQSRRNRHIYCIRRLHRIQHHRSLLYSVAYEW